MGSVNSINFYRFNFDMNTQRISLPYAAFVSLFVLLFCSSVQLQAQTTDDVLRYSMESTSFDPVTIVMPGIATHTGFGGYKANPAAMALAEEGYLSFSLSSRYVDESGTYLGNSTNFSDSQTGIGDIGFLHKVPTTAEVWLWGADIVRLLILIVPFQ